MKEEISEKQQKFNDYIERLDKSFEHMSNNELLNLYTSASNHYFHMRMTHSYNEFETFHHESHIRQEILSRMHGPDTIKLKVK